MANDELRRAIEQAGLDVDDLAARTGVDPKTAQRWLQGRVPHPRHRQLAAQLLNQDEYDLWPDHRRQRDRIGEINGAFPRRSEPGAPDRQALLRSARRQIDLLGYALLEVLEAPGMSDLLVSKANAGVQIRIAIADPLGEPAARADAEHRPSGQVLRRITTARGRLLPLAQQPRIAIRQHLVGTSHTIMRVDEQLLLTIHLVGTPGFQAPLLQLRRRRDFGIFDQLVKHFEDVWASAAPIVEEPAGEPSPDALPERDDSFNEFERVWRPER